MGNNGSRSDIDENEYNEEYGSKKEKIDLNNYNTIGKKGLSRKDSSKFDTIKKGLKRNESFNGETIGRKGLEKNDSSSKFDTIRRRNRSESFSKYETIGKREMKKSDSFKYDTITKKSLMRKKSTGKFSVIKVEKVHDYGNYIANDLDFDSDSHKIKPIFTHSESSRNFDEYLDNKNSDENSNEDKCSSPNDNSELKGIEEEDIDKLLESFMVKIYIYIYIYI